MLDGAGWSVGLAIALAPLFLALDVQVPRHRAVDWSARRRNRAKRPGHLLVAPPRLYRHDARVRVGEGRERLFPPGDPSDAIADSLPDRLTAVALFAVPVAAGLALLAAGLTRKRRWARRLNREGTPAFGAGLDEDFVARRLQERRGSNQDDR
jgi:hypothetical protein